MLCNKFNGDVAYTDERYWNEFNVLLTGVQQSLPSSRVEHIFILFVYYIYCIYSTTVRRTEQKRYNA